MKFLKELFARWWSGFRRVRVPESVWDAYMERAPTATFGYTVNVRLGIASEEAILLFMQEHFELESSDPYLVSLLDDLRNERGEVSLV
jgi:hypothetical protein